MLKAILKGMASVFDLGGTLAPSVQIPQSAEEGAEMDRLALAGDWQTVGDNLRCAINERTNQNTPSQSHRR